MQRRNFLKVLGSGVVSALAYPVFSNNVDLERKVVDSYEEIFSKFDLIDKENVLVVDGELQKMYMTNGEKIFRGYEVSTSKYGFGSVADSYKTPLGIHRIKEKIGDGSELGQIFRAKKNTGKISKIYTSDYDSSDDLITTRVLSLEGVENSNKNSFSRSIYIHGTPEEGLIGTPASHGCIRMKNKDVVELYNLVDSGTYVNIKERLF